MNDNISSPIENQEELLAEPAEEYMSKRQLDFFKRLLTAQREELSRSAEETLSHLRERTALPDEVDRAQDEEEHALELRVRDRERKLLRKIDEALLRIERGEYGWCAETGEPIGLARLLARPTATLSLEGQERKEVRERMFDH
ncbi:RNA polymerase-binding protein DksA [Alkalilimnicola ehrlichii]|uniref:RNA polymerase-binding transcription factor DksA n=1 Tax=Alkalilimnicola ehrlichii TaxID=351052 RepID=A0A3E0WL25_9GAMM|nr:RNA polymerase-binding protein DksA [Alkalilimnicola ehrlichii]RFA25770.1 RNA polymerase-binding protein DksA [Alkalilimnicola ehrlichii]RFA32851.1 RNA polymerase-binding protein DksA [Alkalilimnicola ehrlichii]